MQSAAARTDTSTGTRSARRTAGPATGSASAVATAVSASRSARRLVAPHPRHHHRGVELPQVVLLLTVVDANRGGLAHAAHTGDAADQRLAPERGLRGTTPRGAAWNLRHPAGPDRRAAA